MHVLNFRNKGSRNYHFLIGAVSTVSLSDLGGLESEQLMNVILMVLS